MRRRGPLLPAIFRPPAFSGSILRRRHPVFPAIRLAPLFRYAALHARRIRRCGVAVLVLSGTLVTWPATAEDLPGTAPVAPAVERVEEPAPAPHGSQDAAAGDPGPRAVGEPPSGYNWRGPPSAQRDWPGARRDAAFFFGYQFVAVAVLYAAPESFSGWTEEEKSDYNFQKWRDNVTNWTWDSDVWYVNYVLHPYWGATYYIRARERGLNRTESFWYSVLLSSMWEFGAEALAEQVSIQDLIVTPVFGALLGEYVFSPWRERVRATAGELDWTDKVILTFTDPLGVANSWVERAFGIESTLTVQPIGLPTRTAARADAGAFPAAMPAVAPHALPWGLQLHVKW
jgi:hypothetical protein